MSDNIENSENQNNNLPKVDNIQHNLDSTPKAVAKMVSVRIHRNNTATEIFNDKNEETPAAPVEEVIKKAPAKKKRKKKKNIKTTKSYTKPMKIVVETPEPIIKKTLFIKVKEFFTNLINKIKPLF